MRSYYRTYVYTRLEREKTRVVFMLIYTDASFSSAIRNVTFYITRKCLNTENGITPQMQRYFQK